MRNLIYLAFSFIMIAFTACDPLEDTYNELDLINPDAAVKTFDLTLAKADYELLKGKTGVPSHVAAKGYFESEEEASAFIPQILVSKYPQLSDGSSITVGFSIVTFTVPTDMKAVTSYTLTDKADYALGGSAYTNFDKWTQVESFLKAKYPEAEDGQLVKLTYTWYNSQTVPQSATKTGHYYFKDGVWTDTYVVSLNDYASIGKDRFNNFNASDEPLLADYFNIFLSRTQVGVKEGDVKLVSYDINSSGVKTLVMPMTYTGTRWVTADKDLTVSSTLKFTREAGVWKPDMTIAYEFSTADYAWIADAENNLGTAASRENLLRFNNFSIGSGSSSWPLDVAKQAIAARLKVVFPQAEAGQKVAATVTIYSGGTRKATYLYQKDDSGNFLSIDPD